MTSGYKMGTHKGFDIYVSTSGLFNADVGDHELSAETLDALKQQIERTIKQDLAFKPILAFHISNERYGKITSVDRTQNRWGGGHSIWFSYDLTKSPNDGSYWGSREREKIGFSDGAFALDNADNKPILDQIKTLRAEQREIGAVIESLKKKLTTVTKKDLNLDEKTKTN